MNERRVIWRLEDTDMTSFSGFIREVYSERSFSESFKMTLAIVFSVVGGVLPRKDGKDFVLYVWWRNPFTRRLILERDKEKLFNEL